MGTKNNEICWRLRFHFIVAYWEVLFKEVIDLVYVSSKSITDICSLASLFLPREKYLHINRMNCKLNLVINGVDLVLFLMLSDFV